MKKLQAVSDIGYLLGYFKDTPEILVRLENIERYIMGEPEEEFDVECLEGILLLELAKDGGWHDLFDIYKKLDAIYSPSILAHSIESVSKFLEQKTAHQESVAKKLYRFSPDYELFVQGDVLENFFVSPVSKGSLNKNV